MASRRKNPKFDPAPFQFKEDDLWMRDSDIWSLSDYRDTRDNSHIKIRCRLFYKGDDLTTDIWCLPVPRNDSTLLRWVGELVTHTHNMRVGVIDIIPRYDDYDPREVPRGLLFEDKTDMLLFKLRVQV